MGARRSCLCGQREWGVGMNPGRRLSGGHECPPQAASRWEQLAARTAQTKFTLNGSTNQKVSRATSKQRGELAEMMFMVKAAKEGFGAAKPYDDSQRYD